MGMSITERLELDAVKRQAGEVPELKARIAALEAAARRTQAAPTPAPALPNQLQQINASRQTRCNALRSAIADVLAQAPHPESITAKELAQALERVGFAPIPRERALRLRLAEVRQRAATRGNTLCCQNKPASEAQTPLNPREDCA